MKMHRSRLSVLSLLLFNALTYSKSRKEYISGLRNASMFSVGDLIYFITELIYFMISALNHLSATCNTQHTYRLVSIIHVSFAREDLYL